MTIRSDSTPRKLVLGVQDPALRERLRELLAPHRVEVTHVPESTPAGEIDADVVVLHAESMERSAVLEEAGEEDAPGVVVLDPDQRAEDEVRIVAAGATAVLDPAADRDELAEQLVELVEAEAGGGIHGPESGGEVAQPKLADFQSRSAVMRDFLDVVRRVAATHTTLLVLGETGVGKERLARAIHAESERRERPFVTVNCGALAENLLESELFGHEKGAFTGASARRQGHFETADGGTIFLDEIGEMPLHLQVKLLTVLQRREVTPIGSTSPVHVDVRVIAATNRDLVQDVEEGRFREDLLYRLNVVSLVIPPLRERREDLPWLTGRFLKHFTEIHGRPDVGEVAATAMTLLSNYDWPGNVRELVNVVERAVLLCQGERIEVADLPASIVSPGPPSASALDEPNLLELPLREAKQQLVDRFEREYLTHQLERARGIVSDVAAAAGINPRTLFDKLKRLGLRKEDFR